MEQRPLLLKRSKVKKTLLRGKLRVDGDEKIGLGLSDVGCWVGLHFCWLQRWMALLLLSASGGTAVKMEGLS